MGCSGSTTDVKPHDGQDMAHETVLNPVQEAFKAEVEAGLPGRKIHKKNVPRLCELA